MPMNEACVPTNEVCMLMNEMRCSFRAQKSRGILEGESPRQLKFQRPV